MARLNSVSQGVSEAFDFWLSQHPISLPEIIQEACGKAFRTWLEDHSSEIIEKIAEQVHVLGPES